jgi:hypothetical protein
MRERLFRLLLLIAGASAVVLVMPQSLATINSDGLFPLSLYRDLFERHQPIAGWSFPPAPSAVPDLLVLFPLFAVWSDAGHAYVAYAVIGAVVWTGVVLASAKVAQGPDQGLTAACGALGVFWAAAAWSAKTEVPVLLWTPAYHGGAALVGLVVAVLIARWLVRPATWQLPAAGLLAAATSASDVLLIPHAVVPAVLALVLLRRRLVPGQLRMAAGTLGLAATVGVAGMLVLAGSGVVVDVPTWAAAPRWRPPSVVTWLRDAPIVARAHWPFALVACAWLWGAVTTWRARRDAADRGALGGDFLMVFGVLAVIAGATVVAVTGRYTEAGLVRLMLPAFVYPMGLLPAVFGRWPRWAVRAVWIVACVVYLPLMRSFTIEDLRLPYPDDVRCVEQVVSARGLTVGLGDYWSAKYITELSRTGVRVNAFTDDLQPMSWIANAAWWVGKDGQPLEHHFIVSNEWRPGAAGPQRLEVVARQVCGSATVEVLAQPVRALNPDGD